MQINTCRRCGRDFEAQSYRFLYCPECRVKNRQESNARHMRRQRAKRDAESTAVEPAAKQTKRVFLDLYTPKHEQEKPRYVAGRLVI